MALIKQLKEGKTKIYPITYAQAIFIENENLVEYLNKFKSNYYTKFEIDNYVSIITNEINNINNIVNSKLNELISGTNIKTINGNSILGSGNLDISTGEYNVQSDWNITDSTSDAYIKNKPELFSGNYEDLTNKPNLFSGNYNDLTNKPLVPSQEEFETLKQEVQENEEVIATALVNLDDRIKNSISEIKMNNTSKGTSGIIDLGTVVIDAVVSLTATDASITDGVLTIPALMGKDGEKGDKGDKGEQGILGEPGVKGDNGLNGAFAIEYSNGLLETTSDLEVGYYNTRIIELTETTSNISIDPNNYYRWINPVTSLTIDLNEPTKTEIVNNYLIEFTTSSEGCTLILPETIKWSNGESPEIDPDYTYQLSIVNNLAVIQMYNYA